MLMKNAAPSPTLGPGVRERSGRIVRLQGQLSVPRIRAQPAQRTNERAVAGGVSQSTCNDGEERYIATLVMMMLLVFVLPALMMLVFIALNPEAFQYAITPTQDFSLWHPGQLL